MRARGTRVLWLLFALSLAASLPNLALGQETPQLIQITVEPSKQPLDPIFLRPHTSTSVAFVLKNPTDDNMRNVNLKVVNAANDDEVLVQREIEKISPKSEARVLFAKPKVEKKDKKDDKDKDIPDKIEVVGTPSFKLQVWIETKEPKDLVIKRDVDLIIQEPRDYLAPPVAKYDSESRKLSFVLAPKDNQALSGPPISPVELVLGSELLQTKKGTHKNVLKGPKPRAELFSEDLAFIGPDIREGHVHLTVDGYQRAFTYPVTLTGTGDLDLLPLGRLRARMIVPRWAKPSTKFPVALEIDGPIAGDYRVEVGIDRAGLKRDFAPLEFAGLRQRKVGLGFSPKGDLLFRAEVRDWEAQFDTTGIFGNFWLRLSIYEKNDLTELSFPKEYRPEFADLEAGPEEKVKHVYARVITDDSVPEAIAFVDLPIEWRLAKPLPILVRVRVREEHQAPIDTVVLYKGKPAPDGKLNPDNILGVGDFDEKKGEARFKLPPAEAAGPVDLTVQFTTKTGIVATKTALVKFIDVKGKGICTIKGTLAHGELGQAKRNVTLSDAEGKAKDVVETDDKGNYVFEKVPPGVYTISSKMNYPALAGATKVTVPENVELIEKINVKLVAK